MRWLRLASLIVIAGCGRSGGDGLLTATNAPSDLAAVEPADLAFAGDGGRRRGDFGTRDFGVRDFGARDFGARDLGAHDLGTTGDMSTMTDDMSVALDMSLPPPPPPPADLGLAQGCSNDTQCPGGRCDWLTGQCVPVASCTTDRDCPFGSACVGHQCLPIQVCLPFPGFGACPSGERCAFPPGVCIPDSNCGPGIGPCPTGERCAGGYCQPDGCTSSAECNDGFVCANGQCVPQRYCGPFDPCPRPLRCQAHVCVQ